MFNIKLNIINETKRSDNPDGKKSKLAYHSIAKWLVIEADVQTQLKVPRTFSLHHKDVVQLLFNQLQFCRKKGDVGFVGTSYCCCKTSRRAWDGAKDSS